MMGLLRTHGLTPLLLGSDAFIESLILQHNQRDPEVIRRYRLIQAFHKLGLILGLSYALFYFLIGFEVAGGLVLVTVLGMSLIWPVLLSKKSPEVVGNFFAFAISLTLLVMTPMQGGIHSPSISWLVAPPLVALLLVGGRAPIAWAALSVSSISLFAVLDQWGVEFPFRYELSLQKWVNLGGVRRIGGLCAGDRVDHRKEPSGSVPTSADHGE